VYLNQRLMKALATYAKSKCVRELNYPLLETQKGGHFSANTMCQLFLDIYKACGLKQSFDQIAANDCSEPILPNAARRPNVRRCIFLCGAEVSSGQI